MAKITTKTKAPEVYLQQLYLKTEQSLIDEIFRKRAQGYVDYAEVAALERVQNTLQGMIDESFVYVPKMIEKRFYGGSGASGGYANAASLSAVQTAVEEQLIDALLANVMSAAEKAYETSRTLYRLARLDDDELRQAALVSTAYAEALGKGAYTSAQLMEVNIRNHGITAFVDKAGRNWSLASYCSMATRTTARQAQVAALLTKDDHDLFRIVPHASSCPICAPLQGRVYSKSGTDPNYPPLAIAFGKIDPAGSDDLSNTYLNIHPNCLTPGGLVFAEGVVSEMRRFYRGKVITLKTASGNEITVTPNHPVLTDRGFVAAGQLVKGDKIIETTGKYSSFFGEAPDDVNIVSVLDKKLHSFLQSVGGSAKCVKGSAVQFHGDGCSDEEVDIVFTDSLGASKRDIVCNKKIIKEGFPARKFRVLELLTDGMLAQVFVGALAALHGFMRSLGFIRRIVGNAESTHDLADKGKTDAAGFCDFAVSKPLLVKCKEVVELFFASFKSFGRKIIPCLASSAAAGDAVEFLDCPDISGRGPELFGNLRLVEPALYERLDFFRGKGCLIASELVHVESSLYYGYVYNFETKRGYYVYNNIVTHNCLCTIVRYTEIGKTDKEIETMRQFSNPETNPLNIDPRSKKQVEAYKEKERNRARLLWERRKEQEKRVAKALKNSIITSGARITDLYSPEARRFAETFYPEIRSRKTDVNKIAANTGLKREDVQKVKNYLFMDKSYYNSGTGKWELFEPDCAIAQSWQRLTEGKNIKKHDKTLLKHEIYEMQIKAEHPGISHSEAHTLATKKYNYQAEADEYYGNLRKN